MFDSAVNLTAYLGNTTDNFFKVSNLKMGHNYTFTVQARCLFGSQICGEPAVLLYDELSSGEPPCGRLLWVRSEEGEACDDFPDDLSKTFQVLPVCQRQSLRCRLSWILM